MKHGIYLLILVITLGFLSANLTWAEEEKPEIGIQEHLGGQMPLDMVFIDEDGKEVTLGQLVDKPTILAFVYFNCPGICSPLQTGLAEAVEPLDLEPGEDFRILSVSFDHREGPKIAKKWQTEYLSSFKRKMDTEDWKFLTTDSVTVQKVTDAGGFYFKPDPPNDYIHTGALIVLSPEGKIARYLFGTSFLTFDLKMALVEASEGRTGPTINKVLEYCFSYDPEGNQYVFNFTKVIGTFIFLSIGIFFTVLVIKGRKKDKGTKNA